VAYRGGLALTIELAGYAWSVSVGADLGRYRLISKIGSGGMATVDLAEDTLLGRRVALKRMDGTVDVSGLSRLRREALAGASLNHPNLVSVYDILTLEDGELVIVMEYVQGETLRELMTRRGALPPADALPLLAAVAAGLDAIHGAGIVHRDVKPSNILLGEDGAVKVADLGVASVPDRTQITTSGSIIGSLNYMAPEQLDTGPATPAIDIYALAAVAFEMLSGVKAREAPNPLALAHAIATKPPPSLSEAWPAAPPAATDLLTRGMSREPRARPATAGELVAGLKRALAVQTRRRAAPRAPRAIDVVDPAGTRARARPPRASRPGRPPAPPLSTERGRRAPGEHPARSRGWSLAVLALGLVCVAAALVVLLNRGSSPPPRTAASGATRRSHSSVSRPASRPKSTRSPSGSATVTSSASSPAASGTTPAGSTAPGSAAPGSAAPGSAAPSSASTTASGSAAVPPTTAAASPVAAVESFYRLAAARRYSDAWALADPAFRAQLGGYRDFQAGQANDRSITFDSARVASQTGASATVTVSTTSVQSDGTRHCSGTVDLVQGTARHWLVHQIDINCT
jgi:serine/threonine protein kinase